MRFTRYNIVVAASKCNNTTKTDTECFIFYCTEISNLVDIHSTKYLIVTRNNVNLLIFQTWLDLTFLRVEMGFYARMWNLTFLSLHFNISNVRISSHSISNPFLVNRTLLRFVTLNFNFMVYTYNSSNSTIDW